MRAFGAILFAVLSVFPPPARAQTPQSYIDAFPPPIAPAEMASYCVYGNRVYSLGAGICVGRSSYACVPSTGPATGNRAFWSGNKEDQIFARPVCN